MNRALALLVLLTSCAASLAAADTSRPEDTVVARLSNQIAVRGNFIQTRQLQNAATLRSTGEFIFWRGRGVYWAIRAPLQRVLVYRTDATLVNNGDGAEPQKLDGAAQRQFRDVLLTVFSFDRERLDARFQSQWEFDGQAWKLTLQPLQKSMRRHLDRVEMWGTEMLQGVRIHGRELLTLEFRDSVTVASVDTVTCTDAFLYDRANCAESGGDGQP